MTHGAYLNQITHQNYLFRSFCLECPRDRCSSQLSLGIPNFERGSSSLLNLQSESLDGRPKAITHSCSLKSIRSQTCTAEQKKDCHPTIPFRDVWNPVSPLQGSSWLWVGTNLIRDGRNNTRRLWTVAECPSSWAGTKGFMYHALPRAALMLYEIGHAHSYLHNKTWVSRFSTQHGP